MTTNYQAQRIADELEEPVREANELARKLGLDPYPVNYWIVDNDEMNQLIAYDGFQERYPHWRWGMKFDRQQKTNQYVGGKAFELVNNDDPSNAFLQESNSLADQKAVITHVEAHADFFANNRWFGLFTGDEPGSSPKAAAMLARHAKTIESAIADTDVERSEVERWIDNVLCIEDAIDQHSAFVHQRIAEEDLDREDIEQALEGLGISDAVRREVFDEEWLEGQREGPSGESFPETPDRDLLAFLREHGKRYDAEAERAREMEPWQRDVLDALRTEAYYFAPQRMTKVMNEGWAAYWESMMMGEEGFADGEEFIDYADHQARVLGSPGLNPYKLGKELWEYLENTENRREVIDKLLRIEGVTWRNFHDTVDLERVRELLEPRAPLDEIRRDRLDELESLGNAVDHDALERARAGGIDVSRYPWKVLSYEGLAERHYSLVKPQNRGVLRRITQADLERVGRYVLDDSLYGSVEEAIADVDRTAGWRRMAEVRTSHNDVTFIDEFLTQEFVDRHHYFTYEYAHATGDYRATSTDATDVKKKLLLQFTNFGKPTIEVHDGNFGNRNELLLGHRYNGVALDIGQAKQTLARIFELWGRPVNLMTIRKEISEKDIEVARRRNREPEPTERGIRIRYDGLEFETTELDEDLTVAIEANDIDYDTKPPEWLA
ncbi:SpoVR family protein [Halalkalicoccus jeotgali]|uniref:Stage V sporulation protein R-like protein n=1 Tax=Halalkalicoccus jeotgali (strain DSM 18796 / CECT 7217 / JCM 14584 / KCTC 4019 / B3) TaxID=795797 RepID=D8J359_HALJB|nr:SpoVR family protein [Halalkalicoccus jeotgali]ADJ15166.1 stage V sporulation protein R-like protein [Halalkalicoccus jeotgali B3]ELY35114.1 stage V sporulation protein R-like protein [Halalkalicoccus jeotgali B3]